MSGLADTDGVRDGSDSRTRREPVDAGSGLIEQIIAMVIIVIVMLGLLGTIGATAKSVVTGRQRTIAVSLAKQVMETIQGAKYEYVAMDRATMAADPLITGVAPNQKFGTPSETLVLADAKPSPSPKPAPLRTSVTVVGTTFTLRTFVTTALPLGVDDYRRVTVIIEWPSTSATPHTITISSLVYPIVNTSYPSNNGSAEVTGGRITLSGCLGGDNFNDDVYVALPEVRVGTSFSTGALRSAIGGAGSAASHLGVSARPDASTCATGADAVVQECPRATLGSTADNDSATLDPPTGPASAPTNVSVGACSKTTAGGLTVVSLTGTLKSHAKTDTCACTTSDGTALVDAVPWVDASAATTAGSSATRTTGPVTSLWNLGSVWTPTASVDHDATGSGIVTASAQLAAPALNVLSFAALPLGAVKVNAFTARATAASGYTSTGSGVTFPVPPTVQLWNGTTYVSAPGWMPGSAFDYTAPSVTVHAAGGYDVSFISRIESQQSNPPTTVGTAPRTEAAAEHPSLLRVTVVVTITPSILVTPTTTTTTTTIVATTVPAVTVPPLPVATDSFTIVVDYGQVSANATWVIAP